ncbi:MAG: hypothetical protein WBM61_04185 [Woeseiaceae bacterium]
MAERISSSSKRSRLGMGLGCIALGCYPLSISLGILPVDEAKVMAPAWVVAMSGIVFVIAGGMILVGNRSWANDLLAGILCLLFGIMGTWVSLFSASEGFSGGIPLLPHDSNVALGRWVFGIGALVCFAISAYAFRRAYQSSRYLA